MRSRAESHQPEKGQRATQEEITGKRKGYTGHARSDQQLHGVDPPTLGADQIDKGTPDGLDHPREIEPAGVKGNVSVRHLHAFIHNNRERHDDDIG